MNGYGICKKWIFRPAPAYTYDMAEKFKVLFFDDDKAILSAFRRYFRGSGFDAFYFFDGDELLEMASSEKADLLVSDVKVPGVDIVDLLEKFVLFCPDCDIILLSGDSDSPEIRAIESRMYIRRIIRKNNDSPRNLLEEIETISESVLYLDKDIEELIPPFVRDRIEDCRIALRNVSAGNIDEARQIAHRLKGAGMMYGFDYISRIGEDIEQIPDSTDRDKYKSKFLDLISYLENIQYKFR